MSRSRNISLELATTDDRLAAYFGGAIDKSNLNRKELELSSRVLGIWSILTNASDPSTTSEVIEKHIAANGGFEKLSQASAYRDLKRAARIFGDLTKISLQARWMVMHELGMKMLKLAIADSDLREANKAVKNLIDITLNLKGDDLLDEKPSKYVLEIYVNGAEAPKEVNLDEAANITDIEFEELKGSVDGVGISDIDVRKMLEKENDSKKT